MNQSLHSIQQQLARQIATAGLLAQLRADQPVDLLLEIGDALLAAPVLVVEVPSQHPEAVAVISAFLERHGDHLLVGMGNIQSVAQGSRALAAGAHFLTTTRYTTELHQLAERCGALYIPPATAAAALPALAQMNVTMAAMAGDLLLATAPLSSPAPTSVPVSAWRAQSRPAIVAYQTQPADFSACHRAGATAVAVGNLLFPTADWSMPTMIRRARQLRQLWLETTACSHDRDG